MNINLSGVTSAKVLAALLMVAACGQNAQEPAGSATGGSAGSDTGGSAGSATGGTGGSAGGSGIGGGPCGDSYGNVAPAGRYEMLVTGTEECVNDGSGRVKDTTTGLVWNRYVYRDPVTGLTQARAGSFCQDQGGRLPTKDEALAITGAHWNSCAWPCYWTTWTSTCDDLGAGWHVMTDGRFFTYDPAGEYTDVLCVR